MTVLLIAAGAAVGAPLRYLTDRFVRSRSGGGFPWGTFAVNVVGCLVLGLLVGLGASEAVMAALGVGFCGALTTYSTFAHETARLAGDRARLLAAVNVVASVVAGLGAAFLGHAVGAAFGV